VCVLSVCVWLVLSVYVCVLCVCVCFVCVCVCVVFFVVFLSNNTCFVFQIQPLDTIKVRLQLAGEGTRGAKSLGLLSTGKSIVAKEGVLALYSGYSAAVMRQAVYGTARLGLFRVFSNAMKDGDGCFLLGCLLSGFFTSFWPFCPVLGNLAFWKKAVCGLSSGAIGSFIGHRLFQLSLHV